MIRRGGKLETKKRRMKKRGNVNCMLDGVSNRYFHVREENGQALSDICFNWYFYHEIFKAKDFVCKFQFNSFTKSMIARLLIRVFVSARNKFKYSTSGVEKKIKSPDLDCKRNQINNNNNHRFFVLITLIQEKEKKISNLIFTMNFSTKTSLVTLSTYLHSHRGAQTGKHFYRIFFFFISFDLFNQVELILDR